MATPAPEKVKTTKRGIDLATFEDVSLYKEIPSVPPVVSVEDALKRLNHDNKKLLAIIGEGLQAEAVRLARESNDGWMQIDENGKLTTEVYTGQLADSEDVNPVVLMFAKLNFGFEEATTREAKRESKENAKELIKTMPKIIEGLQKKAAAKSKSE